MTSQRRHALHTQFMPQTNLAVFDSSEPPAKHSKEEETKKVVVHCSFSAYL